MATDEERREKNRGKFTYEDRADEGATPSSAYTPPAHDAPRVDEETPLRIRPDEKTPDPGEDNPVQVPEAQWEQHNRRKDTATALARDEEPIE